MLHPKLPHIICVLSKVNICVNLSIDKLFFVEALSIVKFTNFKINPNLAPKNSKLRYYFKIVLIFQLIFNT